MFIAFRWTFGQHHLNEIDTEAKYPSMKLSDVQGRLSPDLQELSTKVLDLATASWHAFTRSPEVTQEIAKDPFTGPVKEQSGIAEFLLLLLHVCDRIASTAFQ